MAASSMLRLEMILTRLFTIGIAVGTICWTVIVMPTFWSEVTMVQAATRIVAGEVYKSDVMEALEAGLQKDRGSAFRSSVLNKAAIFRLRRADEAIATGNQYVIDASLDVLGQSVHNALANAPSDPYQWLVLFWLENAHNGFKPDHLRYLQMSYLLGPYEAWIAVKRNRLALALFSALPPDLAEAAISEFVGLVSSGLYTDAAEILEGQALPIRAVLLARLKAVPEYNRRPFARHLYDKNLDDFAVPGIAPPPVPLWRR